MLCPFCKETIADGAIKCKHCNEILHKEQHEALKDPQRGQSALNASPKSLIVEPSQTSDSPENISVFPSQMKTDNKTGGGMPSSTLAFIIAATPIISALFIVAYDSVFSTNENALEKLSWIPFAVGAIAMVLNYLLIVADVERIKKADVSFEFNMTWIILTPVYLFKRALAIKQKFKNSSFVNTDGIAAFSLLAIALAVWYPLASISNADLLSTKKSVIENYTSRSIALKDAKFVRDSFNSAVGWLTIGPNNMVEMTAKCQVKKTAFSSQLLWECDDAKNVVLTPEAQEIVNLKRKVQSTRDEWIEVYATDFGTFYVDPTTIRKEGNLRTAWTIQNYKQRDTAGAISTRTTEAFDCTNERYKFFAFTRYSEPMGKGKTVSSVEEPGDWKELPPDSAAEAILKIACAQ